MSEGTKRWNRRAERRGNLQTVGVQKCLTVTEDGKVYECILPASSKLNVKSGDSSKGCVQANTMACMAYRVVPNNEPPQTRAY